MVELAESPPTPQAVFCPRRPPHPLSQNQIPWKLSHRTRDIGIELPAEIYHDPMRIRAWQKYFLLQAAIVLAAISYLWFEGERYASIPATLIVALAFILYLLIFLLWRRAELAEHQDNRAGLNTKQPWEPQG